jgi:small subunit ribosomal protein S5
LLALLRGNLFALFRGRRMRFRAIVVVGNRKGKVGLGTGKATEVQAAVKKAVSSAKRQMIIVPLRKGTIPHQVEQKFKAARIRIMPAHQGTGIIAGGALRVILDHAGVKDCLSKRFGSRNKLVNAQATMRALAKLKPVPASEQDVEVKAAPAEGGEEAVDPSSMELKQVSRKEAEKQRDIHRKGKME